MENRTKRTYGCYVGPYECHPVPVKESQPAQQHDVDCKLTDKSGQTGTVSFSASSLFPGLFDHGAHVNKSDEHGKTVVRSVVEGGNFKVPRLSRGAHVSKSGGTIPLFSAAEKGKFRVVHKLLKCGADVNKSDEHGKTALFHAAEKGNFIVVCELLRCGVDVNKSDEHGKTALFYAVEKGDVGVVHELLSCGADVNKSDEHGKTALLYVVEKDNFIVVRELLRCGADLNKSDEHGKTALFYAVEKGDIGVVCELLRCGADVNKSDEHGKTALFGAAERGAFQALLSRGASASIVDNTGRPALFHTIELVLKGSSRKDLIEIVKLFLSHGESVEARSAAGETLLHYGLSYRSGNEMEQCLVYLLIELCQFLVKSYKADVNVRTDSGHSVIHLVIQLLRDILNQGTSEAGWTCATLKQLSGRLLNLLQCICFSPSCSKHLCSSRDDVDGNTPLHLWASLSYPSRHETEVGDNDPGASNTECSLDCIMRDIGKLILRKGAKVSARNEDGESPLHMAQTWNAVDVLLHQGALPNALDHDGNTSLLKHVKQNAGKHTFNKVYDDLKTEELCEQWEKVLHFGFDPQKANNEGETVLSVLLQTDEAYDMTKSFLKATTGPCGLKHSVDSNGDTPLHVICRDSGRSNFWEPSLIDCLLSSVSHMVNCVNSQGDTALHILCQGDKTNKLSYNLIPKLRAYNAEVDIPNGKGKTCLDIAKENHELMELLTCEIKLFEVDPFLPWSPKSERHKSSLAQVAKGQKARQTGSLHYNTDPIGFGAFGNVYAGILSDGREVALKQVKRSYVSQPKDYQEIRAVIELGACEHLVQYLGHHGDQDFIYIALELMEGTLEELLSEPVMKEELQPLCRDLLRGLDFLHQNGILHQDIKPGNVLCNYQPKRCLKLTDFGFSFKAGTRCWMAPELLRGTTDHSEASDVFSCGLVLYYILSGKKHPFGPDDETGKSAILIAIETERNLLHNIQRIDKGLSLQATDLVKWMVTYDRDKRPLTAKVFEASIALVKP